MTSKNQTREPNWELTDLLMHTFNLPYHFNKYRFCGPWGGSIAINHAAARQAMESEEMKKATRNCAARGNREKTNCVWSELKFLVQHSLKNISEQKRIGAKNETMLKSLRRVAEATINCPGYERSPVLQPCFNWEG